MCLRFPVPVTANVPGQLLVVHSRRPAAVGGVEPLPGKNVHQILHHIVCGGIPACALGEEAHALRGLANEGDKIVVHGNSGLRLAVLHQGGLNVGADHAVFPLARRDQLAHQAVVLEVLHVLCLNVADARHRDGFLVQAHAEGNVGGQDNFVPGVDAVHVGGGVGLGVAKRLGLLQHVVVI